MSDGMNPVISAREPVYPAKFDYTIVYLVTVRVRV